jgi:hypothetical protein
MVHHGWHGTHRYDVQVLATHASTRVNRYSSLLQWSVPLGQRVHVAIVGLAYFARNAHCAVTSDLMCYIPTHKTTSPPERPFSHYIHSHCLVVQMWTTMKNFWKKTILSCSFYPYGLRKYVPCGFPKTHFCNSDVYFETPCIKRIPG